MMEGLEMTWESIERKNPNYNLYSIELHEKIKIISDAISYGRFLINAIKDIHTNHENSASTFSVFKMMYNAFYFQTLVEICKFYNSNDSRGIIKFINILINNHKKIVWVESISVKDLEILKLEMEKFSKSEIMLSIIEVRDKHLAHSDKNAKPFIVKIEDLEKAQNFIENLSNKITNALCGVSNGYDCQVDNSLNGIYSTMSSFKKLQQIILNAHKNQNDTVPLNQLLEITRLKTIN